MSARLYVSPNFDNPHLWTTDTARIRNFLFACAKYVGEVTERVAQLIAGKTSDDVVRPARLKFCLGQDWLESMIELEFIPDVDNHETLTD